jgi:hypothetical protein
MIQNGLTPDWYKLTPNKSGSYSHGNWTKLASTVNPVWTESQWQGWAPLYEGTEVLPDGRVFAVGGEYNEGQIEWCSNAGYYDPDLDVWTPSLIPPAWSSLPPFGGMGDTATATLANGLVFVSNPYSDDNAAFDYKTNSWIYPYGTKSFLTNDEAGLTLLPDGNLYRMDTYFPPKPQAELFNTKTLSWSMLPSPLYDVVDDPDAEIGPGVLMYNGLVFQVGANGANIIFNPANNSWIAAPSFPVSPYGQIDVADGPGVLLPNGNVMTAAGAGYYEGPSDWFIWNGTALIQIDGPPDAAENVGGAYNFLLLPTGQVLSVDQTNDIELYNAGGSPQPKWAPTITSVPKNIAVGTTYIITGTQLNGLSEGSYYGDDTQGNTNYPIIRVTMQVSGDVFYAKESLPSTMGICTGSTPVSTHFKMPLNSELGLATLQVITNGIPSAGVQVSIYPQHSPVGAALYPQEGTNPNGNAASVGTVDNVNFSGESQEIGSLEQVCSLETAFVITGTVNTISATAYATAHTGVTEQIYFYNYATKAWVLSGEQPFTNLAVFLTASPPGAASQYIGVGGQVRIVVRGVLPGHISTAPFKLSVDCVGVSTQ